MPDWVCAAAVSLKTNCSLSVFSLIFLQSFVGLSLLSSCVFWYVLFSPQFLLPFTLALLVLYFPLFFIVLHGWREWGNETFYGLLNRVQIKIYLGNLQDSLSFSVIIGHRKKDNNIVIRSTTRKRRKLEQRVQCLWLNVRVGGGWCVY